MLKDKTIKVTISYRNIGHYRKIGYEPILNQELEINTEHLSTSSHVRVIAVCELCGEEKTLMYHKYILNKKRQGFYGCRGCSRQKAAMTSIEKYGVDNYSKTDEHKERVKNTNLEKYGYTTNLLSPEYQEKIKNILKDKYGSENFYEINRVNKEPKTNKFKFDIEKLTKLYKEITFSEDLYIPYIENSDYLSYRREIRKITKRSFKTLMENWDGYDYYDDEYIMDNFDLVHNDPKYPTIDHKTSVYYGFMNKIPSNEIGGIENLCMTKRSINSSKQSQNEEEYRKDHPLK